MSVAFDMKKQKVKTASNWIDLNGVTSPVCNCNSTAYLLYVYVLSKSSLSIFFFTFSPSMARLVTVIDTFCQLSEGLKRLRVVCEAMPTQQA